MTKIDYQDKINKIFAMGPNDMTINVDRLAITGETSILESFHVGDMVRITIRTIEDEK